MLRPAHLFAIHEIMVRVFDEGRQADRAVERVLKSNKNYGSKDRAAIAFHSYELVRWWRWVNYLAMLKDNAGTLYETGKRITAYAHWKEMDPPTLKECKQPGLEQVLQRVGKSGVSPAVWHSIPDWIQSLGEKAYGADWDGLMEALNQPAPLHLRVNRLKMPQGFPEEFEEMELFGPDAPDAFMLPAGTPLFKHPLYQEGIIEVQDAGSQSIAPFLQAEPGMRVIDACAGAGGKTLHLAALMENKGRIISMDIFPKKLEELKRRSRRAGVGNVEPRLIESGKTIKKLKQSADRLLLDVPCTGMGVWRRNPDGRWKLRPDFKDQVQAKQAEILQHYANMCKVGGKMVYATCSIWPEENEQQVERFLAANPQWKLEDQKTLLPGKTDGFYMARLVRQ